MPLTRKIGLALRATNRHLQPMKKTTTLFAIGILAAAGLVIAQEKAHEAAPASPHGEAPATLEKSVSPKGAKVYFQGLKDGKKVPAKFVVRFGLKGMGIAPAGIKFPNTGHHHLPIDTPDDAMPDLTKPLAMSDTLKHFGAGQTEAVLELPAGEHTLQLIFADHLHVPHDPPVMSAKVKIIVDPDMAPAGK